MNESPILYLASQSPRRRELLEAAGVAFTVRLPKTPVDEHLSDEEWSDPAQAARTLAERKAGALVQELLAESVERPTMVLGADTIVVLDGRVFGKPVSFSHATHMLRTLSGKTHQVITGVSVWLIAPDAQGTVSVGRRTFADVADVTFHPLTDERITDYLHRGESFDKAGAYAAQGEGAALIAAIDGDRDTVIGLPVSRLLTEFPQLKGAC